jgi:hypothetical protein
MKFKKCLVFLLIISIVTCISAVSASAVAISPRGGTIHLNYVQISDVSNGLSADGKTLNVYAATFGYSNATSCGVTATLQKKSGSSWAKYHVWTAHSSSDYPDSTSVDTSITVSSGEYRLVSSHSVTVGTETEYEGMISPVRTVS